MSKELNDFNEFRTVWNDKLIHSGNDFFPAFFKLDGTVYEGGNLDIKTKELLGLMASLISKCDDCVKYHLINCREQQLTNEDLYEVFAIANMAAGSVLLPTIRRALAFWEELN